MNTINVGIDLCKKLNIDLSKFKTKNHIVKYIHSINFNNFNLVYNE